MFRLIPSSRSGQSAIDRAAETSSRIVTSESRRSRDAAATKGAGGARTGDRKPAMQPAFLMTAEGVFRR